MADYGLSVKNNNSEIQIDSTYRNLSLDESGAGITITNNNNTSSYYTRVALIASSLVPLILIRPNTDDFLAIGAYHKTGAIFDGVDMVTVRSQSTVIDWKSYRENRVASGENYGLLVYNPSGGLCFDSGKSYFKIHSVHTINLGAPSDSNNDYGPYTDITHAGISNPYYILSPSSFWLLAAPPPQVGALRVYLIGIKKLTSTSVRVGWFARFANVCPVDYSLNDGNNPTMKLIVCDVT